MLALLPQPLHTPHLQVHLLAQMRPTPHCRQPPAADAAPPPRAAALCPERACGAAGRGAGVVMSALTPPPPSTLSARSRSAHCCNAESTDDMADASDSAVTEPPARPSRTLTASEETDGAIVGIASLKWAGGRKLIPADCDSTNALLGAKLLVRLSAAAAISSEF